MRSLETSNFCILPPPCSTHVHFICDPHPPSKHVHSSELPHPHLKIKMLFTMIYIYNIYIIYINNIYIHIYTITIKKFTSHKKKFEKTEIGLTPPPLFVRFRSLFKRMHPLPPVYPPWRKMNPLFKKIREAYRCKEKK